MDLLKKLERANRLRSPEFGFSIHDWSPTDRACEVAGEVGELCNLIKKQRRGDTISIEMIADEIADVVISLDLLSQRLGVDMSEAIINKFNKTSMKINSSVFLSKEEL